MRLPDVDFGFGKFGLSVEGLGLRTLDLHFRGLRCRVIRNPITQEVIPVKLQAMGAFGCLRSGFRVQGFRSHIVQVWLRTRCVSNCALTVQVVSD